MAYDEALAERRAPRVMHAHEEHNRVLGVGCWAMGMLAVGVIPNEAEGSGFVHLTLVSGTTP